MKSHDESTSEQRAAYDRGHFAEPETSDGGDTEVSKHDQSRDAALAAERANAKPLVDLLEWIRQEINAEQFPSLRQFERRIDDALAKAIEGCLQKIADAHNAALAAERQRRERAVTLLDRERDISERLNTQLLSAQAAIEKHNDTGEPCYSKIDISLSAPARARRRSHTEARVLRGGRRSRRRRAPGAVSRERAEP